MREEEKFLEVSKISVSFENIKKMYKNNVKVQHFVAVQFGSNGLC